MQVENLKLDLLTMIIKRHEALYSLSYLLEDDFVLNR